MEIKTIYKIEDIKIIWLITILAVIWAMLFGYVLAGTILGVL